MKSRPTRQVHTSITASTSSASSPSSSVRGSISTWSVLTRATPIIERYFASGLADGDLSYLGYANKTARIFQALLVVSIGTAIFPVMSKAYSEKGDAGLNKILQHGLRLTLAIGLPVIAILSAVAVPFVRVLFERGAFQQETSLQIARVLPIILIGTVLMPMVGSLLARSFYVKKNTYIVPVFAAMAMIVYIGLAILLVRKWGFVGLATAQMVYAVTGMVALAILLIYKFKVIQVAKILRHLVTYGAASLGAFVIASILTRFLTPIPTWLQLGIAVFVSGLIYMFILTLIDRKITIVILELVGAHHLRRIFKKMKAFGKARMSLVK